MFAFAVVLSSAKEFIDNVGISFQLGCHSSRLLVFSSGVIQAASLELYKVPTVSIDMIYQNQNVRIKSLTA